MGKKRKRKKGIGEIGQGPIELWVEDFISVPRGGMEKKKEGKHEISGRGPIGVCREILPCATRWRGKKKQISWAPLVQ